MSTPRSAGPWELTNRLGSGGNAEVWEAVHRESRAVAAVKLVNASKLDREPYRRFVREIETLQRLSDVAGILPLIDAYLPDKPSRGDRAWLAMPIATLIGEALREQPLEITVQATSEIAGTLARLHRDGIGHRDIKPSNLYQLDGEWLVGDFGLVAIPDVEELTRSGKPIGPLHYTPYEMIVSPATADPLPADVYSLAKTLWVLATGQRFPPDGHQPAGDRGLSISGYRTHWKAEALDSLIDRATVFQPEDRPSMQDFHNDLESWSRLEKPPGHVDIGEIAASFRKAMEDRMAREDRAELEQQRAIAAARTFTDLVRPISDALRQMHPRAEIDVSPDEFTRNVLRTRIYLGSDTQIAWTYQRLSRISVGRRGMDYQLRFGRALELDTNGQLIVRLYIDVGYPSLNGANFQWIPEPWSAPVGSIEAEAALQEASQAAAEQLPAAAQAFVDGVPPDQG